MVPRSLLVVTLIPMVVMVVSSYRYDIFVLDGYRIKEEFENRIESAESVCDCRRRCVDDENCTAVTAVKTVKPTVYECHFSETKTPTSSVQQASKSYVTILKERKPKLYFWSSQKTTSATEDAVFWDLCSADGGKPGVVLSWGDFLYVSNLTAVTTDDGGFIPLRSKVTNEQTGQKYTWWVSLSIHFQDSNPLQSSYSAGNEDELCHRIKKGKEMSVEAKACEGSEAPVLCYTYEKNINFP